MHYKVYFLDGYEITGVETVEMSHERDIKVHNGLGQGNFPIADDKDLKSWDIKCQQEDTSLFPVLEKLLGTQKESRLIISSEIDNISEMVLLESYSKTEQDQGVYDVNLKFIEYKAMSMRTTSVPYIARGGKIPTVPKTIVFDGKKSTPYKVMQSAKKGVVINHNRWQAQQEAEYADAKTGKPYTNPCLIPKNKPVYYNANDTVAIVIGDNYEGSTSDRLTKKFAAEYDRKEPERIKKKQQQEKAKNEMIKAREEVIRKRKEDQQKKANSLR